MKILTPIILFGLACFLLYSGCSDKPNAPSKVPPLAIEDTIRVPADHATIQGGIEAAKAGNVVMVSDGVYSGNGNRDIDFKGKALILASVNGPAATIIDCQGTPANQHRGFFMYSQEDDVTIDGFTIRGGHMNEGGGMNIRSSSPTIKNCIFTNNRAAISGGAVRCKGSSPTFINCTFVDNSSEMVGAALYVLAGSSPRFENCIVAFHTIGEAVYSSEGTSVPRFNCSNIYGNTEGNWIGRIATQIDSIGNLSVNPAFCNDIEDESFEISDTSPCAPANNSCGFLIGAGEVVICR